MKYLLLSLMILTGCGPSDCDKQIIQQRENNLKRETARLNCYLGVLYTVTEFSPLLKCKTKRGQLVRIWARCEKLQ